MDARELERVAGELAASAGLHVTAAPEAVPSARNNRGYRLETCERPLFVKVFYRGDDDERDRLGAEVAFARFAWTHGVRALPEPVAADAAHGVALSAFVDGRRLEPAEIDAARVDEALSFVEAINAHRTDPEAVRLPDASEARFSIAGHLALVEQRIARLDRIAPGDGVDGEAAAWVADELRPAWGRVNAAVLAGAGEAGLAAGAELTAGQRCLSPSDFGFHNALVDRDGRLVFHDFEYAGRDDPAKLVSDFFCQPEVPVPADQADRFADRLAAALALDAGQRARMTLLAPVFRIKWCCIILNEFVATDRRRRQFAGDEEVGDERKREQLGKARRMLASARDRDS